MSGSRRLVLYLESEKVGARVSLPADCHRRVFAAIDDPSVTLRHGVHYVLRLPEIDECHEASVKRNEHQTRSSMVLRLVRAGQRKGEVACRIPARARYFRDFVSVNCHDIDAKDGNCFLKRRYSSSARTMLCRPFPHVDDQVRRHVVVRLISSRRRNGR